MSTSFGEPSEQIPKEDAEKRANFIHSEFLRSVDEFDELQQALRDALSTVVKEPNTLPHRAAVFDITVKIVESFLDCAFYINTYAVDDRDFAKAVMVELLAKEEEMRLEAFSKLTTFSFDIEQSTNREVLKLAVDIIYDDADHVEESQRNQAVLLALVTRYKDEVHSSVEHVIEHLN